MMSVLHSKESFVNWTQGNVYKYNIEIFKATVILAEVIQLIQKLF